MLMDNGPRGADGERLGPDGRQLRACGAVRVSGKRQTKGHSPQTQREGILRAAREYGFAMDEGDIFEDTARGHVLKRKGYQAIIQGIEEGRYQACIVFMFDRIGRASVERVARAHDWDKRGVMLISVMEGVDEPGVLRMVRIGMAEEESRRIAVRVVPNRLAAAQAGYHCGQTPYGFLRVFPETVGERRVAGLLKAHPLHGPIVQWMMESYATGLWSTASLARDLNERGIAPPEPLDGDGKPRQWLSTTISGILSNETYAAWPANSACGTIVYGVHKDGYYMQTPGGVQRYEGKHAPLVSRDVWEQVQHRLSQSRLRSATMTPGRQSRSYLISGLLRCSECGNLMIPSSQPNKPDDHGQVWCMGRFNGETRKDGQPREAPRGRGAARCTSSGYRLDLATDALLAEVSRLQGSPWTLGKERMLSGPNGDTAQSLAGALAEARETLTRATRRFMVELEQPSNEDRAAFAMVRAEIGQRIRDIEGQQAMLKHDTQALPKLRALHQRLSQTEVGSLVQRLQAAGDAVSLRDLVTGLIESATLVERRPATRSTWLRFAVTWQPDVQKLLDAGLLALAPAAEPCNAPEDPAEK